MEDDALISLYTLPYDRFFHLVPPPRGGARTRRSYYVEIPFLMNDYSSESSKSSDEESHNSY